MSSGDTNDGSEQGSYAVSEALEILSHAANTVAVRTTSRTDDILATNSASNSVGGAAHGTFGAPSVGGVYPYQAPALPGPATSPTVAPGAVSSSTSWLESSQVSRREFDAMQERFLDVVATAAGPARGAGVAELARHLRAARRSVDLLSGAELAVDLLSADTDATCEAVAVLLREGWSGTLGELLACARAL